MIVQMIVIINSLSSWPFSFLSFSPFWQDTRNHLKAFLNTLRNTAQVIKSEASCRKEFLDCSNFHKSIYSLSVLNYRKLLQIAIMLLLVYSNTLAGYWLVFLSVHSKIFISNTFFRLCSHFTHMHMHTHAHTHAHTHTHTFIILISAPWLFSSSFSKLWQQSVRKLCISMTR